MSAFFLNSYKTWFSFQILIKLHQPKWCQSAFPGHWVIQPITSLFSSVFSIFSKFLPSFLLYSRGSLSFSIQVLSNIVTMLFSIALVSQMLWGLFIFWRWKIIADDPQLKEAWDKSWGVPGRERPKGVCRKPGAVGQPEVPGTRASLQPCLACSLLRVVYDGNGDQLFSSSQAAKGSRPCLVPRQGWRGKRRFFTRGKTAPYHVQRVRHNLAPHLSLSDTYPPGLMS